MIRTVLPSSRRSIVDDAPPDDRLADNIAIYALKGIAPYYAREPLYPPEIQILIRYADAFKGKIVLDIGVGTGRTSTYLAPHCKTYVGIDLSAAMLAEFTSPLPNTTLVQCDMRVYRRRNTHRYDFVLGSNSAFDALTHADRIAMFADVHAMTVPGAIFAFSTHNLNWTGAGAGPSLRFARDPVRCFRNLQEYRVGLHNHLRMKPLQSRHGSHAILNDVSHRWLALLYYITPEAQTAQLRDAGFEVLEIYDRAGRQVGEGDRDNAVLNYVCRRV